MRTLLITAILAATLCGCAAEQAVQRTELPPSIKAPVRDTVVLLSDATGKVGAVTVTTSGGAKVLDQPNQAAEVTATGQIATRTIDQAEVNRRFGAALAAQSPRPVSFTLYFLEGKDELSPDSRAVLDHVKGLLAVWPAPEVSVIGHTDSVGSAAQNDELSIQRAQVVKKTLIDIGIEAGRIETVGRGEREPLVPSGDEVAEPRNRRVEIGIR